MKTAIKSQRSPVPINQFGQREAQRIRLRKAFPELTRFFPALAIGIKAGGRWRAVVDAYVARSDNQRLDRLFMEVHDLFSMGWTEETVFEDAVCGALGLDHQWVRSEQGTAWRFANALEDHLQLLLHPRS